MNAFLNVVAATLVARELDRGGSGDVAIVRAAIMVDRLVDQMGNGPSDLPATVSAAQAGFAAAIWRSIDSPDNGGFE